MRVAVFGASGGIGRHVVDVLPSRGYDAIAILRRPTPMLAGVSCTTVANLLDVDAVAASIEGTNAVISCVGPRSIKDGPVTSAVTASLIAAMHRTGARRIVVVSAAPVGEIPPDETPLLRFVLRPVISAILGDLYRDLERTEALLARSKLTWTAMRPPRLNNGPLTHRARQRIGGSLPGGYSVSRADVADAMCAAIDNPATYCQPVGIAN
jgi:putative NADH-flavin reductase